MKVKEILGENATMVFPLQQKMELLKKVAGEDNIYDDSDDVPGEEEEGLRNLEPLSIQKKNAGLRLRKALSTDDIPSAE